MNTIEKKVEAAMRATECIYLWYLYFLNRKLPNNPSFAIYCRTLAVVKHDRLLNGR